MTGFAIQKCAACGLDHAIEMQRDEQGDFFTCNFSEPSVRVAVRLDLAAESRLQRGAAALVRSSAADVLEGRRRWSILAGEMLPTLRRLPSASVDALITDPPYSSGGAFRGDRMLDTTAKYVNSENAGQRPDFAGDNRDQRSFAYWCAMWLAECLRIVKPGGICALFTDWRQLPSTTDSLQAGGWVWRGVVPWDKTEATRPQMGRPRAQCEYVVWGSAGALETRADVGVLPGLIRQIVDLDEKLHIAGKPIAVMSELARYCVPNGVILDPFCGSASTGVGALRRGRRFIGCEVDPHWVSVSDQRMTAEEQGLSLAAASMHQTSLGLDVPPPPDSTGALEPTPIAAAAAPVCLHQSTHVVISATEALCPDCGTRFPVGLR